jgi:hypothetical protein
MATSSRRADASRLRKAVDAYRAEQQGKLDKWVNELLARLVNSSGAAQAFEQLSKVPAISAVHGVDLLRACIDSGLHFRSFPKQIAEAEDMLERLPRLDKVVVQLRKFVTGQNIWPTFGQTSKFPEMLHGLDLIAELIADRLNEYTNFKPLLGTAQKRHTKNAAENAAIRMLAVNVNSLTAKPRLPQVAALATVILQTDVSESRVNHAMRERNPPFFGWTGRSRNRRISLPKNVEMRRSKVPLDC